MKSIEKSQSLPTDDLPVIQNYKMNRQILRFLILHLKLYQDIFSKTLDNSPADEINPLKEAITYTKI